METLTPLLSAAAAARFAIVPPLPLPRLASPISHFAALQSSRPLPSASSRTFSALRDDESIGSQAEDSKAGNKREFSVPLTVEQSVEQAQLACKEARKDGLTRLQLELLLPLIGATDLDDWPGGIQQQFKAAVPVVSVLLNGLTGISDPLQDSSFKSYIIDQGDAVGVWETKKVLLVLFPTADSLEKVKDLADIEDRMLLLVNPQWQMGQVISDFGFGAQRRLREEFVGSFSTVYSLKQLRILGEDVRLLKCYPGDWQVFVVDSDGSNCVAVEEQKPSYSRLQDILKNRKGSKASQGWFARMFQELRFNQDSLKGN